MSKVFYDHLVIREEIDFELNRHALDPQEREELVEIIDQTLHHHILHTILKSLPSDKHSEFVSKFQAAPHDESLLAYLKTHAHPEIEAAIKKQAAKVKREILAEIKKSRT